MGISDCSDTSLSSYFTRTLLQEAPTYEERRRKTYPATIPVKDKLDGDGHMTSNYFRRIQVDI
jgi:hypothetical protein